MSDSQEQVRNLFGLSREEKILDDFGCSLSETIPIVGRLYLTEHYICFGSNLFGFNRKYSIGFNEIISFKHQKSSIEIETKSNKKNKFSFTLFTDFNIVYKRIKSMCRSYNENISFNLSEKNKNENLPIILSDSDSSDDESEEELIAPKTSASSKKVSENTSKSNSPKQNNLGDNIIIESNSNNIIDTSSEQKEIINANINIKKGLIRSKSKNDLIFFEEEDNKINQNINNNSNVKRKKSFSSIKSKKSEGDKDKDISPIKKQINDNILEDEEIQFKPLEKGVDHEIFKKVININPKEFFEKYLNDNPETSYKVFYEWVGNHSELNMPNWEKIENPENPEIEQFQKTDTFILSLSGVPLVNRSNVVKTLKYWIDKDGTYFMNTVSRSQGVPLSDCFEIQTFLELHPYMNNTKTVARTYVRTVLLKSTIFRSTLISQGKKSYSQEALKWLEFIQEKGEIIEGDYVYKPKKRRNSLGDKYKALGHGVEKEISQMKNEKHIVDFSDFCKDIYYGTKKYAKLYYDYFYREFDKKTRTILICIFIIFILLISVIQRQNNEIKEIKKEFNEMKSILNNLTNLTLEIKNNIGK